MFFGFAFVCMNILMRAWGACVYVCTRMRTREGNLRLVHHRSAWYSSGGSHTPCLFLCFKIFILFFKVYFCVGVMYVHVVYPLRADAQDSAPK